LAAVGAGLALECSLEQITAGIAALRAVPGRLELVSRPDEPQVLVDYAHKPDALEKVLMAARKITKGKLVSVFGCGGDRDRGKRPLMGGISERLADFTIVTSDNPRTEEPSGILREIVSGMKDAGRFAVIEDRASAIRDAIQRAKAGDTVLIAGKGHEDYQIIGAQKIHFDDREQVREALKGKYGAAA
jgi:UDP-N-acetylmuramoyl-L-alanyl-D-glutamate--2,6-diaminopimelate ligase